MLATVLCLPCPAIAAEKIPEWNYFGGANDDEGWDRISPLCSDGTSQSPVGIDYTTITAMPPLTIRYGDMKTRIERKEHTLVIDTQGRNTLSVDGHSYRLTQIRIHTPSEHSRQGHTYPIELHFIHHDSKGRIMIAAVFIETGAGNQTLQQFIDNAPHKKDIVVNLSFDPASLLPVDKGYFAYTGSLSWPPCTEGVEWRIFKTPITATKEQLDALEKLISRNARTLQPLYMRTIRETKD